MKKKPKRPKLSTTANPHFCTPQWILEPVRKLAPDGRITLDPCSNADSIVDAHVEWRGRRPGRAAEGVWVDGFTPSWGRTAYRALGRARGRIPLVYVNPPFSRGVVEKWLARCELEARSQLFPLHITALIPARLSASWYRRYCYPGSGSAAAVCQLGKRVRFIGATTPCPWEMSLVYWGPAPHLFASAATAIGAVYAFSKWQGTKAEPLLSFYPQVTTSDQECTCEGEFIWACGPECTCYHHREPEARAQG